MNLTSGMYSSTMILFINNTAALEMLAVGALLINCNDVGGIGKNSSSGFYLNPISIWELISS